MHAALARTPSAIYAPLPPRPRVPHNEAKITEAGTARRRASYGRGVQILSPAEFEELVADALDTLPPGLARQFDNVVVVVEDENAEDPELLGLYEGVALTEREHYSGALPDRISLYRIPLCLLAEDLDHLVEEISITVVHEFAHHVGIDEDRLHDLGWG
jgi:predicted Zn-dependent protease with MMP-like domain